MSFLNSGNVALNRKKRSQYVFCRGSSIEVCQMFTGEIIKGGEHTVWRKALGIYAEF